MRTTAARRRSFTLIAAISVVAAHGARAEDPQARTSWNRPPDAISRFLRMVSDRTPPAAFETQDPRLLPRTVRRAARRALGEVLRNAAGLDDLADIQRQNQSRSFSSSGSGDDRVRFRLGVSHLAPKVEMRCATGGGALGVSIGGRGQLAVNLSPARIPGSDLRAGYDPTSKRLDLLFRRSY